MQIYNIQTWQDICNGDAQNSSKTITLSTPQTMLTGWGSQYKLQRPSSPEQGPGPAFVMYIFIILSVIIIFRQYNLTISDQAHVTS
jgi:hypothetical protein